VPGAVTGKAAEFLTPLGARDRGCAQGWCTSVGLRGWFPEPQAAHPVTKGVGVDGQGDGGAAGAGDAPVGGLQGAQDGAAFAGVHRPGRRRDGAEGSGHQDGAIGQQGSALALGLSSFRAACRYSGRSSIASNIIAVAQVLAIPRIPRVTQKRLKFSHFVP